MPFVETFGGQALLPSNNLFLALNMSADVVLQWPVEQQIGGNDVVAGIVEVNASAPGLNIDLSDARVVSQGYTAVFNNVGPNTVTVRTATGATIISLASGTAWMIYLVDNSTAAGTWRVFQLGASVSVANAAALAGAGLKAIATTLNLRIVVAPKAATPYNILDSDRAILLNWTSGTGTFNLPSAAEVGADWFTIIRNSGSGDLTVTSPAGLIDGAANKTFPAGSSAFVVTDGTDFFTIGFGSGGGGGGGGGFGFITINVAGSGNYVLSGAELGQVGYRFTGVLTGTRNIVVPGSTDEYWVDNQTTGAFSLFVKTLAQVPGVEVQQGNRNILYCDGTNVVAAETATVSFPIAVVQGGTGAITAAAARTNLGATVTGSALFTAVDAAAARTAIAAVSTARAINTGFGLTGGGDLSADRTLVFDLASIATYREKSADTSRSSTTLPADDPHLTIASLPIGTYLVTVAGTVGQNGGTQGIRFQFGGTSNIRASLNDAGKMVLFTGFGGLVGGGSTGLANVFTNEASYPTVSIAAISGAAATNRGFMLKALITTQAIGSLTLQWAQAVSSGTVTDLDRGSWMSVQRIA